MSLSDNRAEKARKRALKDTLRIYDQTFPEGLMPDEEFWRRDIELDDQLGEALAVRPLGSMHADGAARRYTIAWRTALSEAKKRGGNPRTAGA